MRTVTKGFDARLADRLFLVFDFRAMALNLERQSARKSKTKNGRLASLASNRIPELYCSYFGNTVRVQVVRRSMLALSSADTVTRAGHASRQSNLPRAMFRLRRVWSPAKQRRPVRAQRRLARLLPPALRTPLSRVPAAQPQLRRLVQRLRQMYASQQGRVQ